MGAVATWYYRTDTGVVGPISSAELERLLEQGVVRPTTLIRRGENGSWFPSEGIVAELRPAITPSPSMGEGRVGVTSLTSAPSGGGPEAPEWYFSLQGKRKMGPVTQSVLADMLKRGKLTATDLVWTPDMAEGVPASAIPGLLPTAGPAPLAGTQNPPAHPARSGADKPAAMPPLAATFQPPLPPRYPGTDSPAVPTPFAGIEKQAGPPPLLRLVEPRPSSFVSRLNGQPILLGGIAAGILALGLLSTVAWVWLRPGPNQVDPTGNDRPLAQSAVPVPAPSTQRKAAASSTARPKRKTEQQNDSLVRSPARKNQSRNNGQSQQTLATNKTKQAPGTSTASVDRAKTGPRPKQQRKQAQPKNQPPPAPSSSEPITLETVLATPGKYTGNTITTEGLYKIGTHPKSVRGPDGKPVGWALSVARTDGSTICSGEAKVLGHDAYLLLDDGLAPLLLGVFKKLNFQITLKPLQRCILTVTVRSQKVAGKDTAVVDITGLEILGACNILKVVEGQFDTAFTIVRITMGNADVAHGNGSRWVDLLGGEEKFVIPMRHRVKEKLRQLAAQRDAAIIDRYLQGEMSRVLMMSNAAQQQTRMFEALLGRRITP